MRSEVEPSWIGTEPMHTAAAAALTALVLGLTAGADATRMPEPRATLAVVTTSPLAIEGRGFGVGEVVRLIARSKSVQGARTAISSSRGRLRIGFDLRIEGCSELSVRAAGSQGSRAALQRSDTCKQPKPKPERQKG